MDDQPVKTIEASGAGLVCPQCGSADTIVKDSRPVQNSIRRRRECLACRARFTSYEFAADPGADGKVAALELTEKALAGLRDELGIALEAIRAVGVVAKMTSPRTRGDY